MTIPAGQQAVDITVNVCADLAPESDEYFRLVITSVSSNALLGDGTGYGLIVDDEPV